MITVSSFKDWKEFGLEWLTGEACGLNLRVLFDVQHETARKNLEEFFGVEELKLFAPWNKGVGCIMLSQSVWRDLSIFFLLQRGVLEVWQDRGDDTTLYGIQTPEELEESTVIWGASRDRWRSWRMSEHGGRNEHMMSGRIR